MNSILFKTIICCCLIIMTFGQSFLQAHHIDLVKETTEINPNQNSTIFQSLSSEEVLSITIKTALDSLVINKKTNNYYPGEMTYKDANGETVIRKIKLKPRGRSRRNYCDFPPLKIKFSGKELKAQGMSKSHRSLKLVTHCNDQLGSKQNILEEYLAYEIYNQLTNNSLKVQLVKIKYIDSNSNKSFKRYGILIEDIDELAARLDGKEIESFGLEAANFEKNQLQTFSMFQYMIGNEDWRIPFKRNVKFIQPNAGGKIIAIPYDFDASGLVLASYAKPDRDLKLVSVRQRSFMGQFESSTQRDEIVALFNAKKEAIYKKVNSFKILNKMDRLEAVKYLDSFYEIINTPELIEKGMPVNGNVPVATEEDGDYPQLR